MIWNLPDYVVHLVSVSLVFIVAHSLWQGFVETFQSLFSMGYTRYVSYVNIWIIPSVMTLHRTNGT